MEPATLEALRGSIAKWERLARGEGVNKGREDCPLCTLFNNFSIPGHNKCVGCPVMKVTGVRYCHDTPYLNYIAARGDMRLFFAESMRAFLVSLLPEESVS